MSFYCYVCNYNFTSSEDTCVCPGCGHTIVVNECSCWSQERVEIYRIWRTDKENWHRSYGTGRSMWDKMHYVDWIIKNSIHKKFMVVKKFVLLPVEKNEGNNV